MNQQLLKATCDRKQKIKHNLCYPHCFAACVDGINYFVPYLVASNPELTLIENKMCYI